MPHSTPAFLQGAVQDLPERALPYRRIEQLASEHPARIAVYAGANAVSYAQLDRMAGCVARAIAAGPSASPAVGICLERSVELVAAIYGTQKAGQAYLPLDLESPPARLHGIVADAGLETVVTSAAHAHLFDGVPVRLILTDDIDWFDETAFCADGDDDAQLSYVIYTSGSTGKPKGVAVSHRSLWNRIDWMQRAYPLAPGDRVAQKTPYTFDVSVWEFFWPLMVGAAIVVIPPGKHKDPAFLLDYMTRLRVNVTHFVPSMLEVFLQFHEAGRCPGLRTVFCSGEAISYKVIERFQAQFDGCRLINLYGPTEAAIDVTWWDCARQSPSPTPPIGRPIQNTQCWIMDEAGQPVPYGETGELYLAGTGLARDYLNNEALTAQAFVPPVPAVQPYAARLYKTGDLARFLPDGEIEYLGRKDDQVKIRGIRVELRELDSAIERDGQVVAARSLLHDGKLVAFVTTMPGTDATLADRLKPMLAALLPPYLLPQKIVVVEQIPVTANGKTDRKALLRLLTGAPAQQAEVPVAAPDAPVAATGVLTHLRAIWATVLNLPVESIADDANFFVLGGDSISMLQVIGQCRKDNIPLSLAQFNANPCLAPLSAQLAPQRPAPTVAAATAPDALAQAEALLRQCWAEALRLPTEAIGPAANFFELGGDSLTMLQVIAQCKRLSVPLSLSMFNQHPVFGALAAQLAGGVLPPLATGSGTVAAAGSARARRPAAATAAAPAAYTRSVTPFQQDMLAHLYPGQRDQRYVLQRRMVWRGDVNPAQLGAACQQLVARHEILRSHYRRADDGNGFLRVVDPGADAQVQYLDGSTTDTAWTRLCAEQAAQGFQLDRAAPLRFLIARVAPDAVALAITTHHLILDGASFAILLDELLALYQLRIRGDAAVPLAAPIAYRDYEDWAHAQDTGVALAHWRKQLAGVVPSRFDARADRPAQPAFGQRRTRFELPAATAQWLAQRGISASTALNLVFALLLSRYYGSLRVTWGNAVTLRPVDVEGAERIVGPCLGSVPLTADLGSEETLSAALKQLQLQVLEAREHGHIGLAGIAAAVDAGNLFDALYTYQSARSSASAAMATGLSIEHDSGELSSHFPLTLSVVQQDQAVELYLGYRRDVLLDIQADDFLDCFVRVTCGLAMLDGMRVGDIDVLSDVLRDVPRDVPHDVPRQPAGRQAMLPMASLLLGPRAPELPAQWPMRQFLLQVERQPTRTALVDTDGRAYTYAQLNGASDRIAHALTLLRLDGAVGISLPRSFAMVAAVLGVMKTPCHFVSLDAQFPRTRLEWICTELGVGAVIGNAAAGHLSSLAPHWIDVDAALDGPATFDYQGVASAGQLCTVNCTSGSTGQPKLVLVSHAAHANRLAWLQQTFPALPTDTYCLKTRLEFAPALREILEPLTQGGRLAILPETANDDLRNFLETVRRFGISRLFLTPSFARLLVDSGCIDRLAGLTVLEISGEPVPGDLVAGLRAALPATRLYNRYGATEAASLVYQDLTSAAPEEGESNVCAVGTPVRNTEVTVVDGHGRMVPRGCVGEIWLSGDSVASGYSDPVASQAAFLHSGDGMGITRGFRTGDNGWVDQYGQLHYCARATRMIKRAGFRIEPREIELALEQHPAVRRCVVLVRHTATGQKLIAFAARAQDSAAQALARDDLKAFAQTRLPAYMLPNDYVPVTAIPATDSGKVDFVKLEALLQPGDGDGEVAAGVTEKQLLRIFQAILRMPALGVTDDFFHNGGDSLLALRIVHEIGRIGMAQPDVGDLYRHPNVRALARHIDLPVAGEVLAFHATHADRPGHRLFAFPPAGGSVHSYRAWSSHLPADVALYAMAPLPPRQGDAPAMLDDMAERYAAFVLQHAPDDNFSLAGWSLGGTIAYAVACALRRQGRVPRHVFLVDPGLPSAAYDDGLDAQALGQIVDSQYGTEGGGAERDALLARLLSDARLIQSYVPRRYSGPLVLIKPQEVTQRERNFGRVFNGFEQCHDGDLRWHEVPGNHMTMMGAFSANICEIIQTHIRGEQP